MPENEPTTVFEGRFVKVLSKNGWEYIERTTGNDVVIVVAMTTNNEILFVEQHRIPLGANVIEFPAGLCDNKGESIEDAAKRELLEETGYLASTMKVVSKGPVSPGLSNEIVHICHAENIEKVHDGGGIEDENIIVHTIKIENLRQWLVKKQKEGLVIDPKIYAGLWFLADWLLSDD